MHVFWRVYLPLSQDEPVRHRQDLGVRRYTDQPSSALCSPALTPTPGTGFATFDLPPPLGTLSLGICMDLNVQPPALWDDLDAGPLVRRRAHGLVTPELVLGAPRLLPFHAEDQEHGCGDERRLEDECAVHVQRRVRVWTRAEGTLD